MAPQAHSVGKCCCLHMDRQILKGLLWVKMSEWHQKPELWTPDLYSLSKAIKNLQKTCSEGRWSSQTDFGSLLLMLCDFWQIIICVQHSLNLMGSNYSWYCLHGVSVTVFVPVILQAVFCSSWTSHVLLSVFHRTCLLIKFSMWSWHLVMTKSWKPWGKISTLPCIIHQKLIVSWHQVNFFKLIIYKYISESPF